MGVPQHDIGAAGLSHRADWARLRLGSAFCRLVHKAIRTCFIALTALVLLALSQPRVIPQPKFGFRVSPRCLETWGLASCFTRTVLLEPLNHAIYVGVSSAKAPCEPVSTTPGNPLAVRNHLELSDLTRRSDGLNT